MRYLTTLDGIHWREYHQVLEAQHDMLKELGMDGLAKEVKDEAGRRRG